MGIVRTTQFPTSLQPDAPLIQDAFYRLDRGDRAYIDQQIIGIQQVIANGNNGTSPWLGQNTFTKQSDADVTLTITSGVWYVYSIAAFTLNRNLFLPSSALVPAPGTTVIWSDDALSANGSLASHNLVINGNGNKVQFSGTQAATITVTLGGSSTQPASGPGGTLMLVLTPGGYWKVQ